jgi:hypothetical protein
MENLFKKLIDQMVFDKKLPKYVYRMRPVNKFLFDSLINSQVWFSNPQDFNDPFDCDINMKVENISQDKRQLYFETHMKNFFTKNELQKINMLYINDQDFQDLLNKLSKRIIQRKGLACFMSNYENLPMWSSYADSHRGVCLKFDIQEDPEFFGKSKKVMYTKPYPEYNYLKNINDFENQMFFTKSSDWSYEGEVRVQKSKKGNYNFNPKSLKEIIFGCSISEQDKEILIKLMRKYYPDCVIKQAKKNGYNFTLDFLEIN